MSRVLPFGRFWWDFVIGDDWLAAAGIVLAIALTATLDAWWFMPPAALLVLYASLRRAARGA